MSTDRDELDTLPSRTSSGTPATLATLDVPSATAEIVVAEGTMPTHGLPNATHATIGLGHDDTPSERSKPSPLSEGSRLGRFLILRKLGEGGMGVVFVGYDGELDRRVALKLLRTRHDDQRAITRLVREAQGLARLSHPNVVQVYEVGQHERSMFIAMELVTGRTLGDWLAAEERSWVDILDALLQAGRGLAAAHAAKLIHRDFKPDNMMVAEDGRVRVLDFGLVRGESDRESDVQPDVSAVAPLDHALTMVGSLLGTPAYMAPEQIARHSADALSDQFSFCVSAFEALYGQRPFGGSTLGELADAIAAGKIRTPRDTHVPRRVQAALVRGLAADPKQRWPDMEGLLAELEASLAVRRGWIWAGAALASVAAVSAVVGLAWQLRQRDADLRQLNASLENKVEQLGHMLSVQQGLQATGMVERDQEADALRLAVLAVGPYAATGDAPVEAIHALETVLADDAQIVAPSATLTSDSPVLWDAAFSPDGSRIVTAGHDGLARIYDSHTGDLLVTLTGHTGVIKAAVFTPDGAKVATASYDHSVRLWDTRSGQQLAMLDHRDEVVALRVSPDGARLAASSYDGSTRLWDLGSASSIDTLWTYSPRPPTLEFDPASARLATTSFDNGVMLWDAGTGEAKKVLSEAHTEPIRALAYSPDGTKLATVSYDGSARLWDAETGDELAVIDRRPQRLHSLAFSPDGRKLVIGGEDRLARVHDIASNRVLATLIGHQGWVTAVAFSPDAKQIITASPDATARVWEAEHGKLRATAIGHEGNIHSLREANDGMRVVTSGEDGKARVWDLGIDTSVVKSEGHRGPITAIEFAPDGSRLATASEDGTVKLWEPSLGALLTTLGDHTAEVAAAKYSPDGRRLATASWDDRVRIWDPVTGDLVHTLVGHHNDVLEVAWSPDGTRLASAGLDRKLLVWDAETAELLDGRVGFDDWIDAVAYAPDGSQLAVGSADGIVRVFDTTSCRILAQLDGHQQSNCPVWLTYAIDGQLATGSCDNHAMLWNTTRGSLAAFEYERFEGHTNSVVALAISPDGRRLATASADHTAKVWGTFGGDLLLTLSGHRGALTTIAFSPDGTKIATGSKDHEVKLWDVVTGELLFTLAHHHGVVTGLVFTSDGTMLGVASEDRASVWDVGSGQLRSLLEDHVGLRRDGGLDWPIPAPQLLAIGCERLRRFPAAYVEAAEVCESQ